jgi:putative phage-type endonuclease
METEALSVDTVIDRFYVKHRNKHDPYTLIKVLHDEVRTVFVGTNYDRQYIKNRVFNLIKYQEQLDKLVKQPKVEQRSQEWYAMRQTRITASDFAQALGDGKFGTQLDFYRKKCGYEKDTFDSSNPALKWGIKYEPVAIDAYAHKHTMRLLEFGLLPHPEINWFGASPDAISELGIMVEIKCPYKRRIQPGYVPLQYYYQIQGQLDVCQLEECDYLECEFLEYANEAEFVNHFDDNTNEKGIIVEYEMGDTLKHAYSPFKDNDDIKALLKWKEETLEKMKKVNILRLYYWQLHVFHITRVYKSKEFLDEKFPQLEVVWNKIREYKQNKELYDMEVPPPKRKNESGGETEKKSPVEQITLDIDTNVTIKRSKNKVQLQGYAFESDDEDKPNTNIHFNSSPSKRSQNEVELQGYAFNSDDEDDFI